MARTLPVSVSQMTGGQHFTLARCVKIITRDNTQFTLTDLDEDVDVPFNARSGSAATYISGEGVIPSDIEFGAGLNAGSTELSIPVGSLIDAGDVISGRFSQASVWIFDIDHRQRNPEPVALLRGWISDARLEEGVATFEVRDLVDRFNQTVGGILTPRCRADFGDTKCGLSQTDVDGVIVAVTSSMAFQTSLGGQYANQYFRFGEIVFNSGDLYGHPPKEVVSFIGSSGEVELFDPLVAVPAVGDHFSIRQGCSRLKSSDDPTVPTCKTYNNVTRFRGFDRVPGSDTYLKIQVPSA